MSALMEASLENSHEVIQLYCESCGMSLALGHSLADSDVLCPSCGEVIKNASQGDDDGAKFEAKITVSERVKPTKIRRRSHSDLTTLGRRGKSSKNLRRIAAFSFVVLGLLIALGWWFLWRF